MYSLGSPLAMMDLNPLHLVIILVIILVLFGGSRIKEIMGGLGHGVREFKKGLSDDDKGAGGGAGTPPADSATGTKS